MDRSLISCIEVLRHILCLLHVMFVVVFYMHHTFTFLSCTGRAAVCIDQHLIPTQHIRSLPSYDSESYEL